MSPAIAITFCLAATLAALLFVFYQPRQIFTGETKTRLTYLRERKEVVYDNLRDLNFEYKAGKYPEADYQAMRAQLEAEAAGVLAEIARLEQAALGTPAAS